MVQNKNEDMTTILYHGSQVRGVHTLEPRSYAIGASRSVVYAASEKAYALSMVYGTGNDLAMSYVQGTYANTDILYVDELRIGALELLNNSGYLYEVDRGYFQKSPEGLESEYVSFRSVPVLSESRVENVYEALKKLDVCIVPYEHVLQSIAERNKATCRSFIKHTPTRFNK